MGRYVLQRVLMMVPLLFLLSIITFAILALLPGDATGAILGDHAREDARAALREELGIDRPIVVQYIDWITNAATGDFGRSYANRQPVNSNLANRIPITVELGVVSLFLSGLIGIPLGVVASLRPKSLGDRLTMTFAVAGVAIPNFFLGMLLAIVFSINLGWLPSTGWVPITEDPVAHFKHIVLPVMALVAAPTAIIARMTRTSMIGVLSEDYVRTARSKGLRERTIVIRHALRNALVPTITVMGLQLATLLGGTIIIEQVFAIPGMGRLALNSVVRHDTPTLQALVVIIGAFVLTVNLIVDILYAYVNPRIRF